MFFKYLRNIVKGQTILRTMMNHGLSDFTLEGKVIDIGGGKSPDYFKYMKIAPSAIITPLDGSMNGIDFEKDPLPEAVSSADTVLCFNLLEHIYNHNFLVGEMQRILKPGGQLIGFVPFFINYHPDPHDYFRYTKEALTKLFAGFREVRIVEVGLGPLSVGLNNVILHCPNFLRPIPFFLCYFGDKIWLRLRPDITSRFPLGYIFSGKK